MSADRIRFTKRIRVAKKRWIIVIIMFLFNQKKILKKHETDPRIRIQINMKWINNTAIYSRSIALYPHV